MHYYTAKPVFVGIDVHKKSYTVHCICEGVTVKHWTMKANGHQLVTQLKRYFAGAWLTSAYEAGFSGYVLHRVLEQAGIRNLVVNPGSIEVASRDRVKTDRRDAKKIAQQLSNGQLASIYIPSEAEAQQRLLTRHRATLIADRQRLTCRIKSKLMEFGYWTADDTAKASSRWIKTLLATAYPEALSSIIHYWCHRWLETTEAIKALDKTIEVQTRASARLFSLERIYRSVPGIGVVSARELSRELGDLSQFSNQKGLYSYTGLTPSEQSSGEHCRRGGISHCGRPRLRHLLIEIAWRSIREDGHLASKFKDLSLKRGKKRAIVAIARILIGRLRTCLRQGVLYDKQPFFDRQEAVCEIAP